MLLLPISKLYSSRYWLYPILSSCIALFFFIVLVESGTVTCRCLGYSLYCWSRWRPHIFGDAFRWHSPQVFILPIILIVGHVLRSNNNSLPYLRTKYKTTTFLFRRSILTHKCTPLSLKKQRYNYNLAFF